MRFLLDEGLPFRLVAYLQREGHDVVTCGLDLPDALSDREILELAYRARRIVLTNDKDFGDLVFRDHLPHAGIVLFRMGYTSIDARILRLHDALSEHRHQLDQFIVISSRGSRVAGSPQSVDELS